MSVRDDIFTHIAPVDGGELRVSAAGPRVNISQRHRSARIPLTSSLDPDAAIRFFTRGLELARLAKAERERGVV